MASLGRLRATQRPVTGMNLQGSECVLLRTGVDLQGCLHGLQTPMLSGSGVSATSDRLKSFPGSIESILPKPKYKPNAVCMGRRPRCSLAAFRSLGRAIRHALADVSQRFCSGTPLRNWGLRLTSRIKYPLDAWRISPKRPSAQRIHDPRNAGARRRLHASKTPEGPAWHLTCQRAEGAHAESGQ